MASASETYLAFFPITNPNSTSQSVFSEVFGILTSSLGPQIAEFTFIKMIGSGGGVAPVSAAWSE